METLFIKKRNGLQNMIDCFCYIVKESQWPGSLGYGTWIQITVSTGCLNPGLVVFISLVHYELYWF